MPNSRRHAATRVEIVVVPYPVPTAGSPKHAREVKPLPCKQVRESNKAKGFRETMGWLDRLRQREADARAMMDRARAQCAKAG